MGGEAAKERRRLKRLAAAQQQNDTVESATAVVQKPETKEGEKGNTAQLRLQRKIARKAQGTFKPLEGQSPPPQHRKREQEYSNRTPSKKIKGDSNHASSKKSYVRNTPANKRSNVGKATVTKKMNKTKPNKPKHLKRKMEHLTKAMSGEGEESTVAQLEKQMQTLAEQMEEFKKIKSGKSSSSIKAQVMNEIPEIAQSKEPDVSSIFNDAERAHSEEENETKRAPSSSAAADEDSSSDEDDIAEQANTRSRGKRRRGRRESNNDKYEDKVEEDKVTNDDSSKAAEKDQKNSSKMESTEMAAEKNSTVPRVTDDEAKQSKKTPKKDDKRRCIGRKPVTDYEIGKCYTGKVQYIKPRLGAFIDIGCHSDAFIHISCISDSYISSVEEVLSVGDEVESARVVAIDREKKRVTLSLRSEDHDVIKSQTGNITTDAATEPVKQNEEKTPLRSKPKVTLSVASSFGSSQATETKPHAGQKTGADLKRERKLARRAARRAL